MYLILKKLNFSMGILTSIRPFDRIRFASHKLQSSFLPTESI